MRIAFRWLPSVLMLLWSASATAEQQDMSVLVLHHVCHDTDQRSQSACSGLLVGLLAGLHMSAQMSREGTPLCLPATLMPDKLILMLDKIVDEKPEFASLPGLEAIVRGLQAVFPCRPPTPPKPLTPPKR
jgi:hypothetical protein